MDTKLAKEQICAFGKRMYELGFANANDGNISVRVSNQEIWITPTGVSKGFLTPDLLVATDLDGNVAEGGRNPSSEFKMHLEVYRNRPDIHCVMHAHPPISTAFAVCRRPLDKSYLPEGIVSLGWVPVTEYATPSTQAVPESIRPFLADHNALLLANHGVLTWDTDVTGAFFKLQTVEYLAQIYLYVDQIGNPVELEKEEVERLLSLRGFYRQYANVK